MLCDLIVRLRAVLIELKAEGNHDLAVRVEQAICDLERGQRTPMPPSRPSSRVAAH